MPNHTIRQVRAAVHGVAGFQIINTLYQLADCLLEKWPIREADRDEAYVEAARICIEAIEDRATPEDARAAFVAACRSADISVLPDDAPKL